MRTGLSTALSEANAHAISACSPSRYGDARSVQRALVVSIHDVAPATQAPVERMLRQLAHAGVPCCSLLVVPDYHHLGRSLRDPAFTEWLQNLAGLGHEIVIHGFYHQRARGLEESASQKLVTRVYTADEGEFYDLDHAEASRRICEAKREFAEHNFDAQGFIAPAWLLGEEALRAAIDAGLRYTTTIRAVHDFATNEKFKSQSLVYSTRSAWRRTVSLCWNKMLFFSLTRNPLLRIGLHPPDIEYMRIWRQIGSLVRKALLDRQALTYQLWLHERSACEVRLPVIS